MWQEYRESAVEWRRAPYKSEQQQQRSLTDSQTSNNRGSQDGGGNTASYSKVPAVFGRQYVARMDLQAENGAMLYNHS